MKKRRIVQRPDGTREIYEEHDEAPAMHKLAAAGQRGDTELAHVNRWEEELLKRLGGTGTRNSRTGLRQFSNPSSCPTCGTNGGNPNCPSCGSGTGSGDTLQALAAQGRRGDTEIAPVNPYQQALLKLLGGSGAVNPNTGLKEFSQLYPVQGMTYDNAAPPEGQHWEYSESTGERVARKNCGGNTTLSGKSWNEAHPERQYDSAGNRITTAATQPYTPPAVTTPTTPTTSNSTTDTTKQPTYVDTNTGGAYVQQPQGMTNMPSYISGDKIKGDFATYFSNPANVGKTYPWPGGNGEQITLGANGEAVLTSPTGQVISRFNKDTPLTDLYAVPEIGRAWDKQFGGGNVAGNPPPTTGGGNTTTGGGNVAGNPPPTTGGGTTTTGGNGFDMPTNIMPTSGSYNTSGGTSQNTANNSAFNIGSSGGTSTSNQNASNYSGLSPEYRDALMKAIMPQLGNAVTNMEGNYDKYTNQALGSYQQMMQNALQKSIPEVLGGMANRGIINSTEGQKILGNVMSSATRDASTKGYETAMQQALLKANMPTVLGNLAQLGQSTQGQSTGGSVSNQFSNNVGSSMGSSQGTSSQYGLGESYSQDPTVMYRTIADLIKNMM